MSKRLEGKTAVVLGASAEGGSGWCTAEVLASEGAHVFVGARSMEGLEKLAKKIGGTAIKCDAANEKDVENFAKAAAQRNGQIDIAVCCAGSALMGSIAKTSREQIDQMLAVNYIGPFNFIRSVAPRLPENGAITIISSNSSIQVFPGLAAYGSAKGALNTLIRYAALEYADRGIRINGINAGGIETPMAQEVITNAGEYVLKETPLKKFIQPAEFGHLAIYLALEGVSITGDIIAMDNGTHLRRSIMIDDLPDELKPVFFPE